MTKRTGKKNFFNTDMSQIEADNAAKVIEKEVLDPPTEPQTPRRRTKKSPKKSATTDKKKVLYVHEPAHQSAKIKAAQKGMNLLEYIEWLIEKDK